MESFGKRLSEAREKKGMDFDQIARETNIARRYLEALEEENFEAFPGEPYLLGFLRNYCEYLGLNSTEMVAYYKNYKIQEAPIPLKDLMPKRPLSEQLFGRRGPLPIVIPALIVIGIVALVFAGYKIGSSLLAAKAQEAAEQTVRQSVTHNVSGDTFKERVYAGDSLLVKTAAGDFMVTVESTAPSVHLVTPVGQRVVELGQDLMIDLSGDGQPDMIVFVADLFRNDPSKGADLHISTGEKVTLAAPVDSVDPNPETTDLTVASADTATTAAAGKQTVLFEGGSAYPVTLNATFRGYCLFRYESDRTKREERYYQKSELLTVQANNGIRIWASNGNAVKLQMIAGGKTVDIELSRPGEVIVKDLKWVRDDESGRYKFVVLTID